MGQSAGSRFPRVLGSHHELERCGRATGPGAPSSRTDEHGQEISTFDGDLEEARAGQSVTLVLADEIDVSRGDLLCSETSPREIADQFEAHVIWMHEDDWFPAGRTWKDRHVLVGVTLSQPKYQVDVNTLDHLAAKVRSG